MAIWIVGSGGFLGNHLTKKLQENDLEFYTSSRDGESSDVKLDLLDSLTFRNLEVSESDFVILLAGISSPQVCQEHYESTYGINVLGTSSLVKHILGEGSKVLFASSDTVYGNQEYPIDETHPCVPYGKYGEMKHKIETTFLNDSNFMSFRLSYIVAENDKFTNYLLSKNVEEGVAQIEAYSDFYRNSIEIEDVLDGLLAVCRNWDQVPTPKIINFCGPASLSRFELALEIKERLGLNLSIRPTKAPEGFFASRPRIINQSDKRFRRLLALQS
jgi:nucleoside-diphosphate-sugar epimerase